MVNNKHHQPSVVHRATFSELLNEEMDNFHSVLYTDGSKTTTSVNSTIYHEGCTDISVKLPNECSVFDAEAYAIMRALDHIIDYHQRDHFVMASGFFLVLNALMSTKHPTQQNHIVQQ